MTFEFLCAGLNFETFDLITFWLSGSQLLRPLGLVFVRIINSSLTVTFRTSIQFRVKFLGMIEVQHFKEVIMVKMKGDGR